MDQTQAQVIVAVIATYLLQWLKQQTWFPAFSENATKAVKVLYSCVVAACSALAITYQYDASLGRLVIDGLTVQNMMGGFGAFLWSLITQHGWYHLMVKPTTNGGVA